MEVGVVVDFEGGGGEGGGHLEWFGQQRWLTDKKTVSRAGYRTLDRIASSTGLVEAMVPWGLAAPEKPRAYLRNIGVCRCVVPPVKLLPILPTMGRNVFMGSRRGGGKEGRGKEVFK